jgi:hypothetical protein
MPVLNWKIASLDPLDIGVSDWSGAFQAGSLNRFVYIKYPGNVYEANKDQWVEKELAPVFNDFNQNGGVAAHSLTGNLYAVTPVAFPSLHFELYKRSDARVWTALTPPDPAITGTISGLAVDEARNKLIMVGLFNNPSVSYDHFNDTFSDSTPTGYTAYPRSGTITETTKLEMVCHVTDISHYPYITFPIVTDQADETRTFISKCTSFSSTYGPISLTGLQLTENADGTGQATGPYLYYNNVGLWKIQVDDDVPSRIDGWQPVPGNPFYAKIVHTLATNTCDYYASNDGVTWTHLLTKVLTFTPTSVTLWQWTTQSGTLTGDYNLFQYNVTLPAYTAYSTYSYDILLDAWSLLNPAMKPDFPPYGSLTYDPLLEKLVYYGGFVSSGNPGSSQVCTWDGTNWSIESTSGDPQPSGRYHFASVFSAALGGIVFFGGFSQVPADTIYGGSWLLLGGNTWNTLFDGSEPEFTTMGSYGELARLFKGNTLFYSTLLQQYVVFGGESANYRWGLIDPGSHNEWLMTYEPHPEPIPVEEIIDDSTFTSWDLPLRFGHSGDLVKTTFEGGIGNNLRNSVMILFNGIPLKTNLGSKVPLEVFENYDSSVRAFLADEIIRAVSVGESRVTVDPDIIAVQNEEKISINVPYIINQQGRWKDVSLNVPRVRVLDKSDTSSQTLPPQQPQLKVKKWGGGKWGGNNWGG